ncbi:hypothetical protein [Streptomyces sp. MMG1121]|uniref:hypothetical protein n=1 Tax=Streptomyces sp. MMG1121 TaxID=1415544 RepID=UPI00131DE909|nr:hypothetical protein [Streptomyces sp. MMG1121]
MSVIAVAVAEHLTIKAFPHLPHSLGIVPGDETEIDLMRRLEVRLPGGRYQVPYRYG